MIYLASPYSGTPLQQEVRYYEALRCAAYFVSWPRFVFSPIVYCHEMAKHYRLPTDALFWKEFDERFIRHSEELWLLCIEGWRQSKGVDMELRLADELKLPIVYILPKDEEYTRSSKPPVG